MRAAFAIAGKAAARLNPPRPMGELLSDQHLELRDETRKVASATPQQRHAIIYE